MSPERWSQVRTLLERVLARPITSVRSSCGIAAQAMTTCTTRFGISSKQRPLIRVFWIERRRSPATRTRASGRRSRIAIELSHDWAAAA